MLRLSGKTFVRWSPEAGCGLPKERMELVNGSFYRKAPQMPPTLATAGKIDKNQKMSMRSRVKRNAAFPV